MPLTPHHFGPGLLLKAILPRRFSTIAYCATQVAIDLEPGYYIFVASEAPIHRGLHTFLGAALVGLAVGGAVAALGIVERRVAARLAPQRRLHPRLLAREPEGLSRCSGLTVYDDAFSPT